jgi:ribA/ribD-fused uncharacterized protein
MNQPINSFSGEHRFLSNFWPVQIYLEGEYYPYRSIEHAYQASKTLDTAIREEIRQYEKASMAKSKGQSLLPPELREDWNNEMRLAVMNELVRKKFSAHNAELFHQLLATGDSELVEGNNWGDTFFGICEGEGENHLGKILMTVRAELVADTERVSEMLKKHKGKRKLVANELGISERTLYRKIKVYNL